MKLRQLGLHAIVLAALVLGLSSCSVPSNLSGKWDVTFTNEINQTSNMLTLEFSQNDGRLSGTAFLKDKPVGNLQGDVRSNTFDITIVFYEQVENSKVQVQGSVELDTLNATYVSSVSGAGTVEGTRVN